MRSFVYALFALQVTVNSFTTLSPFGMAPRAVPSASGATCSMSAVTEPDVSTNAEKIRYVPPYHVRRRLDNEICSVQKSISSNYVRGCE